MQRRSSDSKDRTLKDIVAAADKSSVDKTVVQASRFIRRVYRDVSADDLAERAPAYLAGAALSLLKYARKRKAGSTFVRVFNPDPAKDGFSSRRTIVQMVNDDMPFLVDSLSMVIQRAGLNIHLTVHPILWTLRSAAGVLKSIELQKKPAKKARTESFVLLEIDKVIDPAVFEELEQTICKSMADVSVATADWRPMLERIDEICADLENDPPPLPAEDVDEALALMRWLRADHFTLLGYREYRLATSKGDTILQSVPESSLGILRSTQQTRERQRNPAVLRAIKQQANSRDLLILTKANSRATVHRNGYLDYVGVKTFDSKGKVCGERRFLGLFTSVAYSASPRDVPVLRRKVEQVMAGADLMSRSHGAKALMHILENYPRDELFQITVDDLSRICSGILSLQDRKRVKLFLRRDFYLRFYSCLVYVPRDKYNTQVRQRIQELLQEGFGGTSVESSVQIADSTLARLHIIVRTPVTEKDVADVPALERAIGEAVRTWSDRLGDTLLERFGDERGIELYNAYGSGFPAAYREDVGPLGASFDVELMDALGHDADALKMSLYRPEAFSEKRLRFKLFRRHNPIPISEALPMLENMGLVVISERPYRVVLKDKTLVWIQDFEMEFDHQDTLDLETSKQLFQDTFATTWCLQAENDGFNRLVLLAGLTWRQTSLLRAIAKFLLQTGLPFSAPYMEQIICGRPDVAALLVERFECAFDPSIGDRPRRQRTDRLDTRLAKALNSLVTLDEDRLFRAYLAVTKAAVRTNYFQKDAAGEVKPYLSLKFRCADLPDLPLPRPLFEIFVYSPRFEAIHLRGGLIARGGLRWSDRREDFRTEVLGLMKAQTVKNTLIVPTGAKGGFVIKRLPKGGPEVVMPVVIDCYKQFISGMLDITDNLVENHLVPPTDVVRHDGDDPYLVVAADKGTATFSDIANEVSRSYGFWLDDAFASGGSAGYDHKKMGITAKGAWEAVKRHFRELGVDVHSEPFTVAGIGDMGGDVFGNGMLRSPHTRLLAAFNHLHIFLDPDPDAAASFAERQRLFDLPRSSWADYDPALISKGGGVFSRSDKAIPLSAEVQAMLDVEQDTMKPTELISAILRMPVDLLWNGGIGTYVKASRETHADAGDRTNDVLRINASELRCKVIGEGGNLGFTQLGRVEYALNDGRINTDFIDNSAGVDCSDREVNIKILLNVVSHARKLSRVRRDKLLAGMTDEVDALVLRDNYLQTQAISMMENHAAERLNEHSHLMRQLETSGELDRALEFLPDDEELEERARRKLGLTRPELAVVLSYSKISLYNKLSRS
ncbi:MAG: NAD-glutamate dehydrogenase domain-containing protein, partial [Pseudomonadota bacterium]